MTVDSVDHLGVLVGDVDEAATVYEALGLSVGAVERVPDFGVRIAFIRAGESLVELVEPEPGTDLVADLPDRWGATLHHVAFRVADVESQLDALREAGVPLADEEPRPGAGDASVAFLDRRAGNGVRIELVERHSPVSL